MIPRPLFKILAVPLFVFGSLGVFWLWFLWAPAPQPYYLSFESGLLYERLLLPALPKMPWTTPKQESYEWLGYPCGKGNCMATPESFQAGQKAVLIRQYAPAGLVRQELDEQVYHGSVVGAIWLPLRSIPVLFVTLFVGAVILDARRRKRILNGLQIMGRWPVSPSSFSGWFGGQKRGNIQIPIEGSSDDLTTGL